MLTRLQTKKVFIFSFLLISLMESQSHAFLEAFFGKQEELESAPTVVEPAQQLRLSLETKAEADASERVLRALSDASFKSLNAFAFQLA